MGAALAIGTIEVGELIAGATEIATGSEILGSAVGSLVEGLTEVTEAGEFLEGEELLNAAEVLPETETSFFQNIKSKFTLDLVKKVIKDIAINVISLEAGEELIKLLTGEETKPKEQTDNYKLGKDIANSLSEYIKYLTFHFNEKSSKQIILQESFLSQTDKSMGKKIFNFFEGVPKTGKVSSIVDFTEENLRTLALEDITKYDLYNFLNPPKDKKFDPRRNVLKREFYEIVKENLNSENLSYDILLAFDNLKVISVF